MHRAILESLFDGVALFTPEMRILYWNTAAERITGRLAAEMTSQNDGLETFILEDGSGRPLNERSQRIVLQTLQDGRPRKRDAFIRHKHGYRIPAGARATAMRDENGDVRGVVLCFWDASHRRDEDERQAHLQRENLLDPLTGAGNRRFADEILTLELENLKRHNLGLGLLFADIDHFKRVNDTHGHIVGDKVLACVARTLQKSLRSYDAVARWGGEEFLVILPRIKSAARLESVAERLRLLVEASSVEHKDETLQVTITIGGCAATPDDTVERLLERADRLMYQGKSQGRNQVVISGG
jgi:diguanylate cyclase (GGDEF)-like protein/PAS domain S-box-containing protein